jgi:large subunit ribosomal protein L23
MALFKRKKKDEQSEATDAKEGAKKGTPMKDLYSKEPKKEQASSKKTKTEDVKATKEKKDTGSKKQAPKTAYKILVKPLITEKVGDLAKENKYIFEVAVNANKLEVAEAVKEVYDVNPVKVNIINIKGKRVRVGRVFGKRKNRKKAIVKLAEGESINLHEGV